MAQIKLDTIIDIQQTLSHIEDWLKTDTKYTKPQAKIRFVLDKIKSLKSQINKDLEVKHE